MRRSFKIACIDALASVKLAIVYCFAALVTARLRTAFNNSTARASTLPVLRAAPLPGLVILRRT